MATMNVSLPNPMKDWVETQVKSGQDSMVMPVIMFVISFVGDQQDREQIKILQQAISKGITTSVQLSKDVNRMCIIVGAQACKHMYINKSQ